MTHDKPYADIKNEGKVLKQKLTGALPNRPLDECVIKRGLDDGMWELLCKCWSTNRDDRPLIGELIMRLA